jgi:phosphate transport system permease protein
VAQTLTIRQQVQAATSRLRGLKRADRLAAVVITAGGIGIVASVLGILIVILAEAWPLFNAPTGRLAATVTPSAAPPAAPAPAPAGAAPATTAPSPPATPATPLVMGVDEYRMYAYQVWSNGRLEVFRVADGAWSRGFDLGDVRGVGLTAASRSPVGDDVAAGTPDGRVALVRVGFKPVYQAQKLADLEVAVEPKGTVLVDPRRRRVRRVDYRVDGDGHHVVAAQVADDEVALLMAGDEERTHQVRVASGEKVTALALAGTRGLAVGTNQGQVYHWDLSQEPPRLANVSPIGDEVTALAWALGDVTLLVGTRRGEVSGWFGVRLHEDDTEQAMVRAHTFAPTGSAVTTLTGSTRDKSFLALHADGALLMHFLTSERTLLRLATGAAASSVLITPKNDGILVAQPSGAVQRFDISAPHPEVTWRALFGKVWYEGYRQPDYVWQSTGATNDFETKFSLVPLVFGTLKGTFYALLFAIPLAVLGALYTSQFVHPSIRAKVKPTVEIMAALPSVVIGFVAGLYLAPMVERVVVGVLLMGLLLPAFGTAGVLLWKRLPARLLRRLKPGLELALILPLLVLAAWVALETAPALEAWLFGGDFRLWLAGALGLTYDQRNSLVVGLAMGFAVIPIIFTIADDALSAVPGSLTAGSLAVGASRWQTALRVVLPTASPGIFSAVMVGFGRAVGETMIVLMATGNTPVLDWSIFNGMRTLSANTAVEIPEAPYGGTLYRVLFLSAALLFMMTFAVNTVAEVIRQRLRERYRAL